MAKNKLVWEWHDPVIDLDRPYYTAIGQLVQRWAQLEYQLQEMVWYAMYLTEKQGRILTIGMGVEAIWGILRNIAKNLISDAADSKAILLIVDKMQDLQEHRNYIAHGSWQARRKPPGPPTLHYMKIAAHRFLPHSKHLRPNDMDAISVQLRDLNVLAEAMTKRLRRKQRAQWKRFRLASQDK